MGVGKMITLTRGGLGNIVDKFKKYCTCSVGHLATQLVPSHVGLKGNEQGDPYQNQAEDNKEISIEKAMRTKSYPTPYEHNSKDLLNKKYKDTPKYAQKIKNYNF